MSGSPATGGSDAASLPRVPPAQDLPEHDDVLPVLGSVGCLLGADDVGKIGREDLDAEHVEPDRAPLEILESAGPGRSEGDVQASCSRDEIPEIGASQGRGAAIERQTLWHTLHVDAGIQLLECRGQPLEVLRIPGGRDVRIGSQPGKTVEPGRERADQDIRNFVSTEGLDESLRIEGGAFRHGVPPTRSGSRCRLREAAVPE